MLIILNGVLGQEGNAISVKAKDVFFTIQVATKATINQAQRINMGFTTLSEKV